MSEHPPPDDLDDELDALASEPLRVVYVDPDTGETVEGVMFRDHVARALIERDKQRP